AFPPAACVDVGGGGAGVGGGVPLPCVPAYTLFHTRQRRWLQPVGPASCRPAGVRLAVVSGLAMSAGINPAPHPAAALAPTCGVRYLSAGGGAAGGGVRLAIVAR